MRRTSLLMLLLGVLAFTITLATENTANAITTLAQANETPALAILPAPTMNTAMPVANCDLFDQTALAVLLDNESNIADSPVDVVAWRSMPLKISGVTAMNTLFSPTKIDVSPVATARSTPVAYKAALTAVFYPNDFNAQALALTCETTLAATATSANPGRFNEMPGLVGAVVGDYTSAGRYQQVA